jgi:hypothetical protein
MVAFVLITIFWIAIGFIPGAMFMDSWPGWRDFRWSKLTLGYSILGLISLPTIAFVHTVEFLRKILKRIGRIRPFWFLAPK